MAHVHPFSQLSAEEIRATSKVVATLHPDATLIFKTITHAEPDKQAALRYLEAEHRGDAVRPTVERRAFIAYYKKGDDVLHEAIVNLSNSIVEGHRALDKLFHGPGDYEEVAIIEETVRTDAGVRKELNDIQIPDLDLVIIEPWIYGSDGVDDGRRQYQCFLFCRDPQNPTEQDSNHYAAPLPISPVVDVISGRIVRIDYLPTGADHTVSKPKPFVTRPANEFIPKYQDLRKDLKPLQVVQPEGASFKVVEDFDGVHLLEWQKWRFRVAFNQREGPVLYDVRYDGRPLFYRIALSDMNIPYADPRPPYHRKAAFDLGDAGAGLCANNLQLGCDCLGAIYYLSSVVSSSSGDIIEKPNSVCIHEQDAGIGFKHTNYRTENAYVTRARELVLQTIITVSNYEYILAYHFTQAGDFNYEVRATGILSTQPIDEGIKVDWGTVVHPGVLAAHHQHIFSLRLDPMLDGQQNRVVFEEAHPMARDPLLNPHGTGYYTKQNIVSKSGGYDLDVASNRVFKIQNSKVLNEINQSPVGYKIMVPDFQKGLADQDSFHYKRAEFTDHNIYVTKYRPGQLFAAGQYTNQSRGGAGVRTWASGADKVDDEDIVVWVQFGINHVPRIEDFPVMPVEILKVHFRPANFFTRSPAIDVPPSVQSSNQSTSVLPCGKLECSHSA